MVGEALSLTHLGHLLVLFALKETIHFEIKYIGGLKVLLVFEHSVGAKSFLEKRDRWEEYLSWVRPWDQNQCLTFERVAWIRIVGLPIQYWGKKNLEDIAGTFGKTIAPYDDISNRVDLSHEKIGILTETGSRINEEIVVSIGGHTIKIEITEFDEEWFPFQFDNVKNPFETEKTSSKEEDGEDDDDGISDTWVQGDDYDLEEGEIKNLNEQANDLKQDKRYLEGVNKTMETEPENTCQLPGT